MKRLILILALLWLTQTSSAQFEKLDQQETKLLKKVEIGMSTDEVKKALGRPKSIVSGFPDITNKVLVDLPEQRGQLNSSTWFYFYDNTSVMYQGDIYSQYRNRRSVYLLDGEIIDTSIAKEYLFLKSPRLKILPHVIPNSSKEGQQKKLIQVLVPVLCIVFDKGTQAVSATKIFFLTLAVK